MASSSLCSSPLENSNVLDIPHVPDVPPILNGPTVPDELTSSILDGLHCPAVPQVAILPAPTARRAPLVSTRILDPALVSPHPLDASLTRPRRMPLAIIRPQVHECTGTISNIWSGCGLRPNTTLQFTMSGIQPLHSTVSLRLQGIAQLLKSYPDKEFTNTLITIATSGARIGYEGNLYCQIRKSNHHSTRAHAHIITASIESEIRKGRIRQIASLPDRYYCFLIGLVPKMSDGAQSC